MENTNNEKPRMLGVHTLSEFVFCPRAGIISHEQKANDQGVDTGYVDLSYSPDYDIFVAKLEVKKIVKRLENFSLGILGGTIATVVFGLALKPFLGFLSLLVLLASAAFLSPRIYRDFKRFHHLKKLIKQYDREKMRTPDLENPESERIPWYSLLKSCSVEKCHDLLVDEELGISGKPWKLLHKGKACLPVFFCRRPASASEEESNPLVWIKRQQIVRMKAYCHLIEKNTGKESPCGFVVFAGTSDAVALKFWNNRKAERQLDDAMMIARATLEEYERFGKVGVPAANLCSGCHLGKLRTYRSATNTALRNGMPVRPKLHKVDDGKKTKTLHSVCGDVFRWIPPHEKAIELEIIKSDRSEDEKASAIA